MRIMCKTKTFSGNTRESLSLLKEYLCFNEEVDR